MLRPYRQLLPLVDRGPLRVMFVITSMPVGGAETLLVELIRRMDRERFLPELCCLKHYDVLGEALAREIPTFTGLLAHKYDVDVVVRLTGLMQQRKIDAVVTVGTGGDKMFWGRLAGWLAGAPVICSALHSTGLPDHVEFTNRLLSPLTDAFIAVAEPHGPYLAAHEGCPAKKIRVIPNGIDVERFHPRWPDRLAATRTRPEAGAPVAGIVAALRPEKNHELFLEGRRAGPCRSCRRPSFWWWATVRGGPNWRQWPRISISPRPCVFGHASDVPELLSLMDVLVLTSHMEANPICVLEAMASEKPVVATRVGSRARDRVGRPNRLLMPAGDAHALADRVLELMTPRPGGNRPGRPRTRHRPLVGRPHGPRLSRPVARIYMDKCTGADGTVQGPEPGTGRGRIGTTSPEAGILVDQPTSCPWVNIGLWPWCWASGSWAYPDPKAEDQRPLSFQPPLCGGVLGLAGVETLP